MRLTIIALIVLVFAGWGPFSCAVKRATDSAAKNMPALPTKGLEKPELAPEDTKDRTKEERKVDNSNAKVADLEGQLAKAREENKQDKKALQDSRFNTLRRLSMWMAGIAFLCTCGAVTAAILLPAFRMQFITGAIACLSVMVLSLTVDTIISYIPWIASGILLLGMAALIWWLVKSRKAICATAIAGDMLANVDPTDKDALDEVKELIHTNQIKAGLVKIIQEARGKPVKPAPKV